MPDRFDLDQALGEILKIGEEMLALLRPGMTEEETQRIERLVGRREEVIQAVALQSGGEPVPIPFQAVLSRIAEQQGEVEHRMQSVLESLRRRQSDLQQSQEQITGFRRLLRRGPRSRSLNERR